MIRFAIIGVGGFARTHLSALADCERRGIAALKAAVIRNPDKYEMEERSLSSRGVRVYRSYQELFAHETDSIDVIIVPGGVDQHAEQSIAALEAGFHVLCEKPVAGIYAEALAMKTACDASGKFLAIGFQNIFSHSIQRIKEIAVSRKLGALTAAETYALWARSSAYYRRNAWAGKLTANGKTINDSPAQNALAHYLQNMLYVAGRTHHGSAGMRSLYGENYRAKDIESADTQFVRVITNTGVPLTFIVTHATPSMKGPVAHFHFESGRVEWTFEGEGHTRVFANDTRDGKLIDEFSNGSDSLAVRVIEDTAAAVAEKREPLCTIHNAMQHTQCIDALFRSPITGIASRYTERLPVTREFYDADADVTGAFNIVINEIDPLIERMFREKKSFSETGVPWGEPGVTTALT
ncbi:MAG: Gfo/Idh/MocA family oxidoreductase [Spirochaetes bacterium]|nr:Gfo/Idh/MocA family oxidoreductase [Spirochaetota bacterium]